MFFLPEEILCQKFMHFLAYSLQPQKMCWRTKNDKYAVCGSGPAQWIAEDLSFLFDEQLFRARRVHAIKWLFELTPMLTKIDNNNDGDDNCNYKYDDDGDNDKMQRTKPI